VGGGGVGDGGGDCGEKMYWVGEWFWKWMIWEWHV
jgi:hypothetical protein